MDENNLFNLRQHGFHKGRSCLSQLLLHFDKILTSLEAHENMNIIYLDFSKAFDKVDHCILIEKLRLMGINGPLMLWIQSYLFQRSQKVMVNGVLSEPVLVRSGVPQGSVLGPLLFLVMMADIDEDLIHSFLSSFADDTRVGLSIKTEEGTKLLQEVLDRI